jgi:hypothetical protein
MDAKRSRWRGAWLVAALLAAPATARAADGYLEQVGCLGRLTGCSGLPAGFAGLRQVVSATASALAPATTYFFHVVARAGRMTVTGAAEGFRTGAR